MKGGNENSDNPSTHSALALKQVDFQNVKYCNKIDLPSLHITTNGDRNDPLPEMIIINLQIKFHLDANINITNWVIK